MRMWMINPAWMCRKHLLGEHVELHMFVGTVNKGISVDGYLSGNLMEPASMASRHAELVAEMERRGYTHRSPLPASIPLPEKDAGTRVDTAASTAELFRRCPECAGRFAASKPSEGLKAENNSCQVLLPTYN